MFQTKFTENSRRNFLKAGFISSAVFVMSGCELLSVTTLRDTIKVLQHDLFPKAKELEIDTISYTSLLLKHKHISDEDKNFLKNGVKWLNEASLESHKSTYVKLSVLERQKVLKNISQTEWGDSWLYTMMTYIFEAMLGDPIYGGNNNEAGWKWLEFEGGKPRPTRIYA